MREGEQTSDIRDRQRKRYIEKTKEIEGEKEKKERRSDAFGWHTTKGFSKAYSQDRVGVIFSAALVMKISTTGRYTVEMFNCTVNNLVFYKC